MQGIKIFTGNTVRVLAEKIANNLGSNLGNLDVFRFSDGEMQPVFNESIRGYHVFLIQSTFSPGDNMIELLLMIDAAKRASAGYITAVIPYFGYARQDRKDKPRVPISAKLFSNIIQSAGADRVMTLDLHAEQIQGFFNIPVDHLIGEAIFFPYLKSMDMSQIVFGSPDVGGVKRARAFARKFDTEYIICDKERNKANEVANIIVIGDVSGKDVILIDDLVDTAGTMTLAAKKLLDNGAKSVKAICTHAVLSANAVEKIDNSDISELWVTDTIPLREKSPKIKVITCSNLFADAISYVYDNKSLQALFTR